MSWHVPRKETLKLLEVVMKNLDTTSVAYEIGQDTNLRLPSIKSTQHCEFTVFIVIYISVVDDLHTPSLCRGQLISYD